MTDNRTNEPTPEQVEVAYRSFCEARLGRAMTDEEHEAMRSRLELTWIGPAIAAAAQGAAPVPSSGLDVAKIESLILGRTATAGARAVAEWLKGQGRGSEM